eukprot:Colp12_sorted_trinity150504_noHs@7665
MSTQNVHPILILRPKVPDHFEERQIVLNGVVPVCRAVMKTKPQPNNAVFKSQVLSRHHADIWFENGKVLIQDKQSSNGTFLNGIKLSRTQELMSNDELQFGVDVCENNKVSHKCISSVVEVVLPPSLHNNSSSNQQDLQDQLLSEVAHASNDLHQMRTEAKSIKAVEQQQHETFAMLQRQLADALAKEELVSSKLKQLEELMSSLESLSESAFQSTIQEDKLLSRIVTLERQLAFYQKRNALDEFGDDLNETVQALLKENLELKEKLVSQQEIRHEFELSAKDTVRRVQEEKQDLLAKVHEMEISRQDLETEIKRLLTSVQDMQTKHTEEIAKRNAAHEAESLNMLTELTELRNRLEQLHSELDAAKKAQEQLAEKHAEELAKTTDLEGLLSALQAQVTEYEAKAAEAQEQQEAEAADLESMREQLAEALEASEGHEREAVALQAEVEQLRGQLQATGADSAQLAEVESRLEEATKERDLLDTRVQELTSQLAASSTAHAQQLASLQASVTEYQQASGEASEKAEELKEQLDASEERARNLESELETVRKDLHKAEEAAKAGSQNEGQVADLSASLAAALAQVAQQEAQVRQLTASLEAATTQAEASQQSHKALQESYAGLQGELATEKEKCEELRSMLAQVQDKVAALEEAQKEKGTRAEELETSNTKLGDELVSVKASLAAALQELDAHKTAHEELASVKAELEQAKKAQLDSAEARGELETRLRSAEEALSEKEERLQTADAQLTAAKSEAETAQSEVKELAAQIKSLQLEKEAMELQLSEKSENEKSLESKTDEENAQLAEELQAQRVRVQEAQRQTMVVGVVCASVLVLCVAAMYAQRHHWCPQ